jgi:hypothetical protein
MREIRLCWRPDITHQEDVGKLYNGGLWTPVTPEVRQDYQTILEAALEVYGRRSHWIEEREA